MTCFSSKLNLKWRGENAKKVSLHEKSFRCQSHIVLLTFLRDCTNSSFITEISRFSSSTVLHGFVQREIMNKAPQLTSFQEIQYDVQSQKKELEEQKEKRQLDFTVPQKWKFLSRKVVRVHRWSFWNRDIVNWSLEGCHVAQWILQKNWHFGMHLFVLCPEGMFNLRICGMHHLLTVSHLWLGIFQIFP